MSIKRFNGSEVLPTTHRPKCPTCSKVNRKGETVVLLRVRRTTPTAHPQIFIREYICPRCGYIEEGEYVYPHTEWDYFTDSELAAKVEQNKLLSAERAERARKNFSARWHRKQEDDEDDAES